MQKTSGKKSPKPKKQHLSTNYIRFIALITFVGILLIGTALYQSMATPSNVLGASTVRTQHSCQWWNLVCVIQQMFEPKTSTVAIFSPVSHPLATPEVTDTTDHLRLTKNFVDLNDIASISKYRSCEGHVVVSCDQTETKRSMKHYFRPKSQFLGSDDKVKLYAPFDAVIYKIFVQPEVTEISLYPVSEKGYFTASKYWNLTIQHIKLLPHIKEGMEVTAGQQLGFANFSGKNGSFDINVNKALSENESGAKSEKEMKAMFEKQHGGSDNWSQYKGNFAGSGIKMIDGWGCPYSDVADVFDSMSDHVLAEYAAHGVSRDQMSFTKGYRDAHQCVYIGSGPYFNASYNTNGDWVYLK